MSSSVENFIFALIVVSFIVLCAGVFYLLAKLDSWRRERKFNHNQPPAILGLNTENNLPSILDSDFSFNNHLPWDDPCGESLWNDPTGYWHATGAKSLW
jgi:hypothetical protein